MAALSQRIQQVLAPPVFADEESNRIARLSNIILLACLIISPILGIGDWLAAPSIMGLFSIVVIELIMLIPFWFLRRGDIGTANTLLIAALATTVTMTSIFFDGGLNGASYGTYFVIVVYASILLGRRAASVTAGVGILIGIGLLFLEKQGLLPSAGSQMDSAIQWVIYSVALLLVVYSTHLSSQSLQQAAALAQQELGERRQAETTIRKQLSVMETALDGIAIIDGQGKYLYANPAFARLQAVGSPAELIGQQWRKRVEHDMQARVDHEIYPLLLKQGVWRGEFSGIRWDGSSFQQELSIVHLGQGEHAAIVRDISEHKRAEETLLHSQKLESLSVLAGGIAHDFNNMLAGILGQASLAKAKLPAASPALAHLERVIDASTQGAALTRQLLAYAGKGNVRVERFNLNDLIRENRALFATVLPKKVQLALELTEALPLLEADVGQIQQLLLNLLMNAAEAIDDRSGRITLRSDTISLTDPAAAPNAGGDVLPPGAYVRLTVVDDGVGMDKSTIQRIFEPFFTTKGYGRGLGLSATLGIIRLHKGGLLVESQPGQGSTFQILLPASTATASETLAHSTLPDSTTKNMVLVVDDEPDIREVVAEILQMEGLLVLTAENGRQGVESFQAHQTAIGVIVLDMQMPVMNGAEAAKTMLALDPGIQVILTSGYSEHDLINGLAKHPSVDFLQKPYTLDRLVATVQMKLQATPLQRSVQIPPC